MSHGWFQVARNPGATCSIPLISWLISLRCRVSCPSRIAPFMNISTTYEYIGMLPLPVTVANQGLYGSLVVVTASVPIFKYIQILTIIIHMSNIEGAWIILNLCTSGLVHNPIYFRNRECTGGSGDKIWIVIHPKQGTSIVPLPKRFSMPHHGLAYWVLEIVTHASNIQATGASYSWWTKSC